MLSIKQLRSEHEHCKVLQRRPHDPTGTRKANARYNGAKSVLIKGAKIWTGEPTPNHLHMTSDGNEAYTWQSLDVLLEYGLITRVSNNISTDELAADVDVQDGYGRLLTAGIVDMHTHAGVDTLPATRGNSDDNELSSDITPYVKSLDAINPLDHQIQVIKSGGVTTSLVLPGSGNNIGGEAFVIKHAVGPADGRPEISVEDMLADPERNWRYMKSACGENAKRVYGRVGRDFGPFSRMGEAWYFRHAFEQAKKLVDAQDEWCAAADRLGAERMTEHLPLDLELETLGAVLRGQVHVNTHCYTITDLESFIRLSNEFQFPVRAFHHAHQTYLVPEILKRNYGGRAPAAALFADNMYYKAEAYIGSEQAGKILHENGITPVYVSDNPVINAQHVLFEAAKAHKYGLPYHVALAGVTSASAELLGLGERIGKVKQGFDADLVMWDSDPLSVGATPVQVWIDGAPQFKDPVILKKDVSGNTAVDTRYETAVRSDSPIDAKQVCFQNISTFSIPGLSSRQDQGKVLTIKLDDDYLEYTQSWSETCATDATVVSLRNGHMVQAAIAFGSHLGLEEISAEPSTNDGENDADSFSAAADGLSFDTKALRAAYSHGVSRAITAPSFSGGGFKGSSVGFRINAKHTLEKGAIWQSVASIHYSLLDGVKGGKSPSMSSAIGELKVKLLKALQDKVKENEPSYEREGLAQVVKGELALVITVHKADTIATLISMKLAIDSIIEKGWKGKDPAPKLRLVLLGAAEAFIHADELAKAEIGVVLAPAFPYAVEWEQRRSLSGAPLTNGTAIDVLTRAGVKLALGTAEDWETRDLFLMAGIARANSGGYINNTEALALVSSNIFDMLGLKDDATKKRDSPLEHIAIFEGDPLTIQSQLRGIFDGRSLQYWE